MSIIDPTRKKNNGITRNLIICTIPAELVERKFCFYMKGHGEETQVKETQGSRL